LTPVHLQTPKIKTYKQKLKIINFLSFLYIKNKVKKSPKIKNPS